MITHDLGVVAEICDEVLVMYAGRVVEQGPWTNLRAPAHPYTWGLLGSMPGRSRASGRLIAIPGTPPSLLTRRAAAASTRAARTSWTSAATTRRRRSRPRPGTNALNACHLPQEVKDREGARFGTREEVA